MYLFLKNVCKSVPQVTDSMKYDFFDIPSAHYNSLTRNVFGSEEFYILYQRRPLHEYVIYFHQLWICREFTYISSLHCKKYM